MQLLTNVEDLDVGTRNLYTYRVKAPMKPIPNVLLQSVTLVRLVGHM